MPSSVPRRPGTLRIVVSDDDQDMLTRVVKTLRAAGHGVLAAYDGQSACELAEYLPEIDLIITNTRLTNCTSPELIRRVRKSNPWLAILHVGERLPAGDALLANVPVLPEPFTDTQLLDAIGKALAAHPRGPS